MADTYKNETSISYAKVTVKSQTDTGKGNFTGTKTISFKIVKRLYMYRLYNKWTGEHFYTSNYKEAVNIIAEGWKYEGIGWYSDDTKGVALYRQYNPYAKAGSHNYTASSSENKKLVSLGWKAEGVGWYGIAQ